ncbi:MAG: lysoplasmalogenase [Deltaproteobacteria bacterium]|nr:lysoplasmalogenase [Deltaproteobacteria bacterium]
MSTLALVVAIAGTAITVLAMPPLLLAECAARADLRRKIKPIASLGFLIAAVAMAPWRGGFGEAPTWLAIGLVLGAVGDVALMYDGERAFLAGLGAFLLGHAAYVLGFAAELPFAHWLDGSPVPLVAVAIAGVGALAWLWRGLGSMKIPVIAYVLVISAMVVGAFAVLGASPGIRGPKVAVAAALLFYASDLSVARDRFIDHAFINRAWGLPAYYAGQLLFAWSMA